RLKRNENTKLPIDFEYSTISGLSNEMKQKLLEVRPESIAQVSRIPGVTPAAISLILVFLKKKNMSKSIQQAS
ncbi:MAG: tRNA uridine 5-carboxymethylaminomethyl modification enzyme, partial [Oleiphilaceae bacterium]